MMKRNNGRTPRGVLPPAIPYATRQRARRTPHRASLGLRVWQASAFSPPPSALGWPRTAGRRPRPTGAGWGWLGGAVRDSAWPEPVDGQGESFADEGDGRSGRLDHGGRLTRQEVRFKHVPKL